MKRNKVEEDETERKAERGKSAGNKIERGERKNVERR